MGSVLYVGTIGFVAAGLTIVALSSILLPAHRAAILDPNQALHEE